MLQYFIFAVGGVRWMCGEREILIYIMFKLYTFPQLPLLSNASQQTDSFDWEVSAFAWAYLEHITVAFF